MIIMCIIHLHVRIHLFIYLILTRLTNVPIIFVIFKSLLENVKKVKITRNDPHHWQPATSYNNNTHIVSYIFYLLARRRNPSV